jgi:hypothetical protein
VDGLPGLVDGLVRAEHQPPTAFELDGLPHEFLVAAGVGDDAHLVAAVGPVGQAHARTAAAGRVGLEARELNPAGI